jgi:hypothetical protein
MARYPGFVHPWTYRCRRGAWAVARQGTPMLCSTGRRLGMTGPSAWKRLPRTPVGHKQQAVNGSCQVGYFRLRSSRYQNESP